MKAAHEARRIARKIAEGSLPEDEPVFTLRARDRFAASMVRTWAILAEKHGSPAEKVREAQEIADRMEEWPVKQTPGRPGTRSKRPVLEMLAAGQTGNGKPKKRGA